MVVYCENMYNVQLSSQKLFSQLHVEYSKALGQLLNGSSSYDAYSMCVISVFNCL